MPVAINRHPEAMYLHFADLPYKVSWEFADNFVANFSPGDDIKGLEILWDDSARAGSEPAMLALGVFGSALAWLGCHYTKYRGTRMRRAVLRKAGLFIAAADLGLRAAASGATGLTFRDAGGNALLCADLQCHPRHALIQARAAKSAENSDRMATPMADIRSDAARLAQTVLPKHPGAIGVAVTVDELSLLRNEHPVAPGRWIDWPEALLPNGSQFRAHIAIIPPHDRAYPWLPKGFLGTRGAVNPAEPSPAPC